MDDQKYPMTPQGKKKLEARLKTLKNVDKPANIKAIEEARGHGDLKENAEYHAAKEQQGMIESQIRLIEHKLSLAEVIDPSQLDAEHVVFGATVTLLDLDTDEKITYTIVGEDESNITTGHISISSPIARGLIGKREGDEARIKTPKGVREFEIITISFGQSPRNFRQFSDSF